MKLIKKILIANRGEIAVRIIKSAHNLGIKAVAVFSEVDRTSLHVRLADEAYCIGEQDLNDTYLNIYKLIEVALAHNCDAIHPGYGFLAENPLLVKACDDNNITFIGPDVNSIALMGNKIESRKLVKETGVPVTEGITGTADEMVAGSSNLDYPVLVKAAAGGGGKGMRIVHDPKDLPGVIETTSREALNYFGDGTVYIEKYIEEPRHIEVQVLGDNFGNVIHLFERECTIQRRYQKIIEESPSPTITPEVREKICNDAVKIAQKVKYNSAGTVEFLVDNDMNYYFLEMNTRIQVEHPVTEMVTGIDIVDEQILAAAGNPLRLSQSDVSQAGVAIECRIYAEDPENNFMPSPGDISLLLFPEGDYIRLDSSIDKETRIHSFFDPMISKIIAYGDNREQTVNYIVTALEETIIHGIKTNIPFLINVLEHEAFRANMISTKFCDLHAASIIENIESRRNKTGLLVPLVSASLQHINKIKEPKNLWEKIGYWRNNMTLCFEYGEEVNYVEIVNKGINIYSFIISGKSYSVKLKEAGKNFMLFELDGKVIKSYFSCDNHNISTININGNIFVIKNNSRLGNGNGFTLHSETGNGTLFSPMPGKVIKINVKEGDKVERGTVLLVVEAMKMENNIVATDDSVVDKINVSEGDMVDTEVQLVVMKD